MDAAPLVTLNIRLADAYRVEDHGLRVLESISDNRALPERVRSRADLHGVETSAQRACILHALQMTSPTLAQRLTASSAEPLPRTAILADWSRLERREIAAYADLLPYLRFAGIEGLASECAAALDLQRSVLHWLESLDAAEAPALAAPMPAGLRLAF